MRALEGLREVSTFLEKHEIADSLKEAEVIITECIGIERVTLYRDNPPLSAVQRGEISSILKRRQVREPLQYIIGSIDFYGLKMSVGPGVLIPRPETELIVEEAIKTVGSHQSKVSCPSLHDSRLVTADRGLKILDLCSGSGCLALAIAKEFPDSSVVGTDISEESLEYAVLNAKNNGITNVTFLKGDLYEPVHGSEFELIVSNPPYIKRAEIGGLSPEIREWEPLTALDGGEDGLWFYRKILSESTDYLTEGGSLIIELGQGEADDVIKIAQDTGLRTMSLLKDYAGVDRVLHLRKSCRARLLL